MSSRSWGRRAFRRESMAGFRQSVRLWPTSRFAESSSAARSVLDLALFYYVKLFSLCEKSKKNFCSYWTRQTFIGAYVLGPQLVVLQVGVVGRLGFATGRRVRRERVLRTDHGQVEERHGKCDC